MNLKSDCLSCLLNQSLRVAKNLNLNEETSKEMMKVASIAIGGYGEVSPPVAAADLYPRLANFTDHEDVYRELKALSTLEAMKLLPEVEERVNRASNRLSSAIKAAVAGNVIDFATPNHFDLTTEFEKVFETDFALDDEKEFLERLKMAKSFMVVGDNVGEHVFDKLLLKGIAETYPHIKLYYAVRGKPIINDVTLFEAKEVAMEEVAMVVDSGVITPGLAYEYASKEFMELYNSIDIIVAKGMGNYECLEGVKDERLFHLFKVKCDVVAIQTAVPLGSLVFAKNHR